MYRVIPFPVSPLPLDSPDGGSSVSATATYWKYPVAPADMNVARPTGLNTYLMATLNATPDSFSDGSTNNTVPAALAYADAAVGAGADIVDVGGYSTRPGAPFVTPEEEIARVVPVIQALRQAMAPNEDAAATDARRRVLISVDTFRPDVARAAVQAGANVINDVYAFAGPGFPLAPEHARHFVEFRRVARELSVPVVLMHSRGDAGANKDYSAYDHAKDSGGAIVEAVKAELGERVEAAVRGPGGLRRWNVIVDPGVGFSKTLDGNLELLRRGAAITSDLTLRPFRGALGARAQRNPLVGFPQLIGASRKSFLGVILERPDAAGGTYAGRATAPKERGFATAGAVAAAVQQGALVVRVHDVLEMGDVVRIADALWR
jgi:dihydroneopterin aldolase/2-amino-4-hydroxy-6-hydroxymethyldihydropteridine diphosphokinase/dihydropteroate synthase